jgi:hypothetical protein
MDPKSIRPIHWLTIAAGTAALLLAGCTSTKSDKPDLTVSAEKSLDSLKPAVPPPPPAKVGEPARVVAAWDNKILYAPDPTKGGADQPGLQGRIYLMSPEGNGMMKGDGTLVVDLYDNTPKKSGGEPKLLEVWQFDKDSLVKLAKADTFGECYAVFLPWSTYNIDLKSVNMIARYTSGKGTPFLTSPESLSLDHTNTLQKAAEKVSAKQ